MIGSTNRLILILMTMVVASGCGKETVDQAQDTSGQGAVAPKLGPPPTQSGTPADNLAENNRSANSPPNNIAPNNIAPTNDGQTSRRPPQGRPTGASTGQSTQGAQPSGQESRSGGPANSNAATEPKSTMPEDVFVLPEARINFDFPPTGPKMAVQYVLVSQKSDEELKQIYTEKMAEFGWVEVNTIDNTIEKRWTRHHKKGDRQCRVDISIHASIQGRIVTVLADPIVD